LQAPVGDKAQNSPVNAEDPQLEIATDFVIWDPIFLPSDNSDSHKRTKNYFSLVWVTIQTL
jgi:hypothetical protein